MFSNETKHFFNNINILPDELIDIIHKFIPNSVLIFLNKELYTNNHYLVRYWINKLKIEQYIRTMIRQDNDFVLKQLLYENTTKWLRMNNYLYRDIIFANYLYFIKYYADDYESPKCEKLIIDKLIQLGLSKNQHKKKLINII